MVRKIIIGLVACFWMLVGSHAWAQAGHVDACSVNANISSSSSEGTPTCGTYEDFDYCEYGHGVTIVGYHGSGGEVVIPANIDGMPVTGIGDRAFRNYTSLTSVVIPDSVTDIEYAAFSGCTGLTSVHIGNGVTGIGWDAFRGCTGLTSIVIPDSVTSIGPYAFRDCLNLTSVHIGNGVTTIGNWAFASCTSLTSVVVPDSVITIDYAAFRDCTGLVSVHIGNGVTGIRWDAFRNCTGLASVHIGNSVIGIGDGAFYDCTGLTSIVIPDSVTTIGEHAFRNCTSLASAVIGSSVISIRRGAFSHCTSLTSVVIPDSVTSMGDAVFFNCTGLTSVVIGNSVTRIGNSAFYSCTSLTSAVVPDSVTSIGEYAFYFCTGLTSMVIPDSVTTIGKYAFYHCTGLTSVVIGNSVTGVGDLAFYRCNGLTSIVIPDSVTSIGRGAFATCLSLTRAYFLGNAPLMDTGVFLDCASDFKICSTAEATGFTSPTWYGYPAEICYPPDPECFDDSDCDPGYFCLDGECLFAGSVKDTGDPNERVCNPHSYTDLGNGIVRDNVTGLQWQQASAPGTYTLQEALDYCGSLTLGGYSDWRLPAAEELSTLVDTGRYDPAIAPIFSDTIAFAYWSSTVSAINSVNAWFVDFSIGGLFSFWEGMPHNVRAVRGPSSQIASNFVDNGDGTIIDTATGLMWQQETAPGRYTVEQAIEYCMNVSLGGYSDWRLPTRNDLHSLVDYSRSYPATAFPDPSLPTDTSAYYWSSTAFSSSPGGNWYVYFANGNILYNADTSLYFVRAVRGGSCREDVAECVDDSDCPEGYACIDGQCQETTLVTLDSFTAAPRSGKVILNWTTAAEIDNAGFNLYRAESENGEYEQINPRLIPAQGQVTMGATYEFIDTDVQNRKTYWYKLEDVDYNGTTTLHGPVSATPRLVYGFIQVAGGDGE